jgi:hypothetical protein
MADVLLDTLIPIPQKPILLQDEGVDLGAGGTVTTLKFAGDGVTATRAGNVVTVTVPGDDADIAAAILEHEEALDPHPQYVLPAEALDTAVAAADAAVELHEEATDPHTQYHNDARADIWVAAKNFQSGLQFEDDGVDLGAAGTVNELNFQGDGVTVGRVGNRLTVTVTGGSASQVAGTYLASEVLGGHRIVRSTGNGEVGYADCSNAVHGDDTVGLTLGAVGIGENVTVQHSGYVTNVGWSWTMGLPIFLSTTGLLTQTQPASGFVQVVGHAADTDTMFISIETPIYY